MTLYNPNIDLINVNEYTKFGKILSIGSQDIEWKRNGNGKNRIQNYGITEGQAISNIAPTFFKAGL